MGKAKKSRAVRVKFAQTKRLLSPKDCRLKGNQEKEETKRKKVGGSGKIIIQEWYVSTRVVLQRSKMLWSCRSAASLAVAAPITRVVSHQLASGTGNAERDGPGFEMRQVSAKDRIARFQLFVSTPL